MRRILVLVLVVLALGSGALPGATGLASAAGSVPGTPGPASAVPGDASATVTWRAPARDGGSPITGYVVTPYLGDVAQTSTTFTSTATTQVVSGLQDGGQYRFRVAAVNANGTGPASGLPGAFSVITVGAPLGPTDVVAVGGAGTALVTWTPPAPAALELVNYTLTARRPTDLLLNSLRVPAPGEATSATLTLEPGEYTISIEANTAFGAGPASYSSPITVTSGVPRAPLSPKAIARNGRATVSWTGPGDPTGAPITGYRVTPTVDGVVGAPVVVSTPALIVDVPGLPNGSSTSFTVAATNAVGTGPESDATVSLIIGAPTVAGVARGVPGDGTATVTWSPPVSANGSPVTGYVVTPHRDGAPLAPVVFASTATTQVVGGLENGRTYQFRVAATNARGTGVASPLPSLSFTTVGAPLAPTVTAVAGSRQITATWTEPAGNGSAVVEYVAYLIYDGDFGGASDRVVDRTVTFTNVVPNRGARIQVVAVNGRGEGAPGTSNLVTATAAAPLAPGQPRVVAGNGSVDISWARPADQGDGPITGYVVTPVAAGTPLAPIVFAGPGPERRITGLSNGVRHTFTVQAVNAAGTGEASVPSTSVIVGTPVPPIVTSLLPGDGSATVAWNGGSDNNSPITSYTVTTYLGSTALASVTVAAPAQQATIAGLQNGSTYTFRVAATNARGRGLASARGPVLASPVGSPAPSTVTATAIGSGQLSVSWTPGSAGPSPITSFDVVVVPVGGSLLFAQKLLAPPGDRTATLGGLSVGVSYAVYVVANNAYGGGPAGAAAPVIVT